MEPKVKFTKNWQDKFHASSGLKREVRTRKERLRYLIVCEGEKTEPNYFESFKKHLPKGVVDVDIIGAGEDTLRIVQIAKGKARQYDKVWVVFDRDSFPASDFDNAIHSADANSFGCAWSNEAFELWYLLHFEYRNTAMSRDEYKGKLSEHLNEEYQKNDPDMFKKLEDNQKDAIRNSERLLTQQSGITPSQANPATQVHLLVEELNEYRS